MDKKKIIAVYIMAAISLIFLSCFAVDFFYKEKITKAVIDYCDQNKNCRDTCLYYYYAKINEIQESYGTEGIRPNQTSQETDLS